MVLYRFFYDPQAVEEFTGLVNAIFDAGSPACHPYGDTVSQDVNKAFRPRLDVRESTDNNEVVAAVDLPGLKKSDVTIEIDGNRLTISGEMPAPSETEKVGFSVRERQTGKFSRSLHLPKGTKAEHITAKMEDGVLKLTFPKSHPELVQHVVIE